MAYIVAVASTDGKVVNEHFGRADHFYILEVEKDGSFSVREKRQVNRVCDGGSHDEDAMLRRVKLLADCDYVLVARIGPGAENALEAEKIAAFQIPDVISDAVQKLLSYIEINEMLYGARQL